MIKSIRLTNFFSFQDEEITLNQQINILVGINGSGKSNLLKAIYLLKIGVEGNADDSALRELIVDRWGGFDNIYCKAEHEGSFKNTIGIEYRLNGEILSRFGNGSMTFRNDIIYKIIIIKKLSELSYLLIDLDDQKEQKNAQLAEFGLNGQQEFVFFMIQEMEAWFISQPEILDKYYNESISTKLPKTNPQNFREPAIVLEKLTKNVSSYPLG